jgi:hypothetical protein
MTGPGVALPVSAVSGFRIAYCERSLPSTDVDQVTRPRSFPGAAT